MHEFGWSSWQPLYEAWLGEKLPNQAGLYRIRRIGPHGPKAGSQQAHHSGTRARGDLEWSERQDLNLRPPAPQAGALPGCATLRLV